MQAYIECGSAWMSATRSSIRMWRWIYAWTKRNNFVGFRAQLACWRRNCHSHNDREASWGELCEALFIFQAIIWVWRIFQADGEQTWLLFSSVLHITVTSPSIRYPSQMQAHPGCHQQAAGSSGRDEDTPGQGGGGATLAGSFWEASAGTSCIQLAKRETGFHSRKS